MSLGLYRSELLRRYQRLSMPKTQIRILLSVQIGEIEGKNMLLLFATQPSTYHPEPFWCRGVQINLTINIHGQPVFSGNY